jgi:hypothetical protein
MTTNNKCDICGKPVADHERFSKCAVCDKNLACDPYEQQFEYNLYIDRFTVKTAVMDRNAFKYVVWYLCRDHAECLVNRLGPLLKSIKDEPIIPMSKEERELYGIYPRAAGEEEEESCLEEWR